MAISVANARTILGKIALDLSDEEIAQILGDMYLLANSLLDQRRNQAPPKAGKRLA